jgi:hypothetical protein
MDQGRMRQDKYLQVNKKTATGTGGHPSGVIGLNREVQPVTPGVRPVYYPAGETGDRWISMDTRHTRPAALAVCLLVLLAGAGPAAGASGTLTPDPGAVTIVAGNGPDYNPGTNITFFGTNTGSGTTYLFITGPNLAENGSRINSSDPRHWPVYEGNASTFQEIAVSPEGRWSWTWDTRGIALDPGIYLVYAVGRPHDRAHLELTPYGTATVILTDQPLPAPTRLQDVPPATVAVSAFSADPAGDLAAGVPVAVSATIDLPSAGTETFPPSSDLLLETDLDKPRWTVTLFLDGVENPLPEQGGRAMPVTGWVLSYPPAVQESLRIILQGTVPSGQSGRGPVREDRDDRPGSSRA